MRTEFVAAGVVGIGSVSFVAWRYSEWHRLQALVETLNFGFSTPGVVTLEPFFPFWSLKTADTAFSEYKRSPQFLRDQVASAKPLVDLSLKNILGLRK